MSGAGNVKDDRCGCAGIKNYLEAVEGRVEDAIMPSESKCSVERESTFTGIEFAGACRPAKVWGLVGGTVAHRPFAVRDRATDVRPK